MKVGQKKKVLILTVLVGVVAVSCALVWWSVPISFGKTMRVSNAEILFASHKAEMIVYKALSDCSDRLGVEGDSWLEDSFEMGGAIPDNNVGLDGVGSCMAASYPIYKNGIPFAMVSVPIEGRGNPAVAGNYTSIQAIGEAERECLEADPSCAYVYIADEEGPGENFERGRELAGTLWMSNEKGGWFLCLPEDGAEELRDAFRAIPEDVKNAIKFSDGDIRIALDLERGRETASTDDDGLVLG